VKYVLKSRDNDAACESRYDVSIALGVARSVVARKIPNNGRPAREKKLFDDSEQVRARDARRPSYTVVIVVSLLFAL
jgi:hypothetical protein